MGQSPEAGPVSASYFPGSGVAAEAPALGRAVSAARLRPPRFLSALAWLALAATVVVIALVPLFYAG